MLATFGCNLQSMVFSSLTATAANEIAKIVTTAITNWEPRVTVQATVVTEGGAVRLESAFPVTYLVRQTNSRSNLVYPFYLSEAGRAAAGSVIPPATALTGRSMIT